MHGTLKKLTKSGMKRVVYLLDAHSRGWTSLHGRGFVVLPQFFGDVLVPQVARYVTHVLRPVLRERILLRLPLSAHAHTHEGDPPLSFIARGHASGCGDFVPAQQVVLWPLAPKVAANQGDKEKERKVAPATTCQTRPANPPIHGARFFLPLVRARSEGSQEEIDISLQSTYEPAFLLGSFSP